MEVNQPAARLARAGSLRSVNQAVGAFRNFRPFNARWVVHSKLGQLRNEQSSEEQRRIGELDWATWPTKRRARRVGLISESVVAGSLLWSQMAATLEAGREFGDATGFQLGPNWPNFWGGSGEAGVNWKAD